jgi:hypothetical protein
VRSRNVRFSGDTMGEERIELSAEGREGLKGVARSRARASAADRYGTPFAAARSAGAAVAERLKERIASDEEESNRRGSLDSRFQDAEWRCGNPADETRVGSFPGSSRNLWERRVSLSQRPKSRRTLQEHAIRLEKGLESSQGSLLQEHDLRSIYATRPSAAAWRTNGSTKCLVRVTLRRSKSIRE